MIGFTGPGPDRNHVNEPRGRVPLRTSPASLGVQAMGDKVPLRWIEDAEAKQVVAAALFERTARQSWCTAGRQAIINRLSRLRARLALREPIGWPSLQARPAPIRVESRPPRSRRSDEDQGYRCDW